MAAALRAMGVGIEEGVGPDGSGEAWRVIPSGLHGPATVDVGNAGTVMRFLPPVAALADGPVRFDGDPRSYERPLNGVIDALRVLGARIDDDSRGSLPMTVHGGGALDGGRVEIDASSSSQFVSALLLSAPRFNQGVEVRHVGGPLPSMPHIRMTVDMLRTVGAQVDTPESGGEPNVWRVTSGALLGRDLTVEPDLSNAQPFLAAALVTGGKVIVPDWPERTTQPGDRLREIFTLMGGSCELTEQGLEFTGSGSDPRHRRGPERGRRADARHRGRRGARRLPLHAARAWRTCVCTRRTGWPRSPRRSTSSAATSPRPPTACTSGRAACTAGSSTRTTTTGMATAGAILGLAVPGVEIENVATTAKTLPDFPDLWAGMLGELTGGSRSCAATARTPTRTTSASAPTARATARARTSARSTRTPPTAWS